MSNLTPDLIIPSVHIRLWSKIDTSSGPRSCWPWRGSTTPAFPGYKGLYGGYGRLHMRGSDGKNYVEYAHRLVYVICFGAIPEGTHVLHKCDNPVCCNPAHLYAGTPSDNARDRERRARHPSRIGLTTKEESDICEQFSSGQRARDIADVYGLESGQIYSILARRKAYRRRRIRKVA